MLSSPPGGTLSTHLVQAYERVESLSCRCSHLCVVFLQDQHVKHQLVGEKEQAKNLGEANSEG